MTPRPRRPPRPAAPARYLRRAVPGWRRRGAQGPAGRVQPQLLPQVVLRHGRHRGTAAPPPGGARRSLPLALRIRRQNRPRLPIGRRGRDGSDARGREAWRRKWKCFRKWRRRPQAGTAPSRLGPAPEPRSLPAWTRLSPAPEPPRSARRFARPWPVPGTRSPSDPRKELTAQRSGDEAALLSVRYFIVKQHRDTPAHTWLHFLGTEVLGCSLVD